VNLKQQRDAALKAAQDIVAKAKAENRELTDAEQAEVEAKEAEFLELDKKVKAAEKSSDLSGLHHKKGLQQTVHANNLYLRLQVVE
jgi:hypothetical protein